MPAQVATCFYSPCWKIRINNSVTLRHRAGAHRIDSSTFCRALVCCAAAHGTHSSPSTSCRAVRVIAVSSWRVLRCPVWYMRGRSSVQTLSQKVEEDELGLVEIRTYCTSLSGWMGLTRFSKSSLAAWYDPCFSSSVSFCPPFWFLTCSFSRRSNLVKTAIIGIFTSCSSDDIYKSIELTPTFVCKVQQLLVPSLL